MCLMYIEMEQVRIMCVRERERERERERVRPHFPKITDIDKLL